MWTRDGRPQVALCLYQVEDEKFDIEFQSLAPGPLIAESGSAIVWRPSVAGVQMQPLVAAPEPATTLFGRLRQMRQIARGFSGKIVQPGYTEIPLRLLATPLYRYPDPTPASPYVDGALFALVQGTDPEILLLIEAVKGDNNELRWQYGIARMTMVPTEVTLGDEKVWETDWATQELQTPYYTYQIRAVE